MLISSFHLLLHKHCQQLRISGRTAKREERGRRRAETAITEVLLHGRRIPRGGRRSTNQIDRCKPQNLTIHLKVSLPKQFERITWCSFLARNVAKKQECVPSKKRLRLHKLRPPESWYLQKCLKVRFKKKKKTFSSCSQTSLSKSEVVYGLAEEVSVENVAEASCFLALAGMLKGTVRLYVFDHV